MITRTLGITITSTCLAAIVLTASSADAQTPPAPQTPPATSDKAAGAAGGAAAGANATGDANGAAPARPAPMLVEPPSYESTSTDVAELPGKAYYYLGLRYRGNVVPKAVMNLFVDGGATIYSNSVGIEFEARKDNFSLIPALTYTEYGTDNILFLEKGKPADLAGNWNNIKSSLKAFYATADLLWSTKMGRYAAFEYGAGFGLGYVFGDLETSWVYEDAKGPYEGGGRRYSPCTTATAAQVGCKPVDHSNATTAKINHYVEPSWFDGGSRPSLFLHISPQIGVRVKPAKEFQARVGLGFSLTGFWFGISGDYGLERALEKKKQQP